MEGDRRREGERREEGKRGRGREGEEEEGVTTAHTNSKTHPHSRIHSGTSLYNLPTTVRLLTSDRETAARYRERAGDNAQTAPPRIPAYQARYFIHYTTTLTMMADF